MISQRDEWPSSSSPLSPCSSNNNNIGNRHRRGRPPLSHQAESVVYTIPSPARPPVDRLSRPRYGGGRDYTKIITVEPDKRSGQPCIRGIRMTVQDVMDYLGGGMTVEEILENFPNLTREDSHAGRACAADALRPMRLADLVRPG